MDAMGDLNRFKSELTTSMLQIFNNEQNLPLLNQMYRTYQYASRFPWNYESGQAVRSSSESAQVQFLGVFGISFCSLTPHHRDKEVVPSDYYIPEEPTFEQWLDQIREAIVPAFESNDRLKLIRSRFELSLRRTFKDGVYSADRLEQFLLNGVRRYIGFWQNADRID